MKPTRRNAERIAKRLGIDGIEMHKYAERRDEDSTGYYYHHVRTTNSWDSDAPVGRIDIRFTRSARLGLIGFIAACEAIEREVKRCKTK